MTKFTSTVSQVAQRSNSTCPVEAAVIAQTDISDYFQWYDSEREHSSLNEQTPDELYFKTIKALNIVLSYWSHPCSPNKTPADRAGVLM
ncbi:hypothetical protein [Hydromonas duriensis]|uniref:Integrase-like protein n=1 Tax=Hydromonas duriensis TaxID=1527608 RepID=A0A4R6Y8U2_9BURK|nr:hypothetical protein [Hydromonas duriensis]TDR31818.1 hypothetical protein DFR44_10735 [Hydromonas duriensis]